MEHYSCNLSGQCEANFLGTYRTQAQCQARCHPTDLKADEREMMFIALSYDPDQALLLAPSDKVEYLVREYGIRVNIDQATPVLTALYSNDYLELYSGRFRSYLNSELRRKPPVELDWFDFMLLQILVANRALVESRINWDYVRASSLMGVTALLGRVTLDEFEEDIPRMLRNVYDFINGTASVNYRIESVRLNPDQAPPAFMNDYIDDLRARFITQA